MTAPEEAALAHPSTSEIIDHDIIVEKCARLVDCHVVSCFYAGAPDEAINARKLAASIRALKGGAAIAAWNRRVSAARIRVLEEALQWIDGFSGERVVRSRARRALKSGS